jgi:transcriptional regulator with XRE-family HTH domain
MRRTNLQGAADRRAAAQHGELAEQLRRMAADAGVSRRVLATTSGLSVGYVTDVLAGSQSPTLQAYHRLASTLGADLSVKLYANTGPHIHARWQAPMLETVLRVRDPRWDPYLEALVTRPVQGWIDLALHERRERVLVATELQSEMRRAEQLIRWQASKAAALPSWEGFHHLGEVPRISQLMIVRRTRATLAVVAQYGHQLRAAFPAHPDDAVAALTGPSPWPGSALAWMVVDGKGARLVPGR